MDYNETLKYISNTPKFSKTLGNAELLRLLEYLGNPQDSLKFIHVAGTNGKGSVCAMTARILQSAGYKTGLYVSPFINVFNERIQINGEYISDYELSLAATTVRSAISDIGAEISEFAQITAMAFLYFKKQRCDFVVLETGLGGRLDATNVIKTPVVCVITKIGLDHTKYLGGTLSQIATEKCGIIKTGIPVVTCYNQETEALSVIHDECRKCGSALTIAGEKTAFNLSLSADYQQANAAVSEAVCRILNISDSDISYGLSHTQFPARFEFLRDNLIIDGAHNPDGASALISSLKKLKKPVIIVSAMMADKDYNSVCSIFSDFAEQIIATQLDMPRCLDAATLAEAFIKNCAKNCIIQPDYIKAVNTALADADGKIVCVCGSLFLAAEIRKHYFTPQ